MNLLEQINSNLLTATKNNQPLVRDTLRMVKTAIKNSEIKIGHPLADNEIIEIISKEVKQRRESVTSFTEGNRPELAEKEQSEIDILLQYLPTQLTQSDVEQVVDQVINELKASSVADFGEVMKVLMPKLKGKADGNLINQVVRAKLS